MEFCDDGDLYQKIQENQRKGVYFLEKDIWRLFIQVRISLIFLIKLKKKDGFRAKMPS